MTAVEQETMRLVIAPDGKAWVDGGDRFPGMWEDIGDAAYEGNQSRVHYPVEDDDAGWKVVAVPADEPASKADLMSLAAQVEALQEDNRWLRTSLTVMLSGIQTYLDPRRGDLSRYEETDGQP